jgi:hypothetical protein
MQKENCDKEGAKCERLAFVSTLAEYAPRIMGAFY